MGETILENQVERINPYKDMPHSKQKIELLQYCFNNILVINLRHYFQSLVEYALTFVLH